MHYGCPIDALPRGEYGVLTLRYPKVKGEDADRLMQALWWVMILALLLTYKRNSDILMTVSGGEMKEVIPYTVRVRAR